MFLEADLLNDRRKDVVLLCGQAALVVLLGRDGATIASGFPYDILVWTVIMYGLQSK